MSVILETSIGDMTVDLYTDERPRCCLNFLKLCKTKYYNFSLFHTVQKDLVAQTGDPTATGRGGQSIFGSMYGEQARFFEMEAVPRILHSKKGLVSMVNNGSGMHGSQFFITLADSVDYLNNKHTVFGEVAEGMDIVDKLNNAFCDADNRPHQDIRIYHTIILDDPFDDPASLVIPPQSPPPTQEMLDSDRIPCDAEIHDDRGLSESQLAEMEAEREAKANTQLLEMVGDLPDQEIAPPENVLFVCKLNPVTTSDDLEIIFSRFGNIVSCEVIKDQKTGESLQYAFVEFEKQEFCEMAYFKMDNVLIDDRRIHVDFSQSVSKLKWKGKGRGVEVLPDGNAPKYVLKNQQRESRGYDLVLSDDELRNASSKTDKSHKRHKKEKKSKKEKSPSPFPERREREPTNYRRRQDDEDGNRSRNDHRDFQRRQDNEVRSRNDHRDFQRRQDDEDRSRSRNDHRDDQRRKDDDRSRIRNDHRDDRKVQRRHEDGDRSHYDDRKNDWEDERDRKRKEEKDHRGRDEDKDRHRASKDHLSHRKSSKKKKRKRSSSSSESDR